MKDMSRTLWNLVSDPAGCWPGRVYMPNDSPN